MVSIVLISGKLVYEVYLMYNTTGGFVNIEQYSLILKINKKLLFTQNQSLSILYYNVVYCTILLIS